MTETPTKPFPSVSWDQRYDLIKLVFRPADGSRYQFHLSKEEAEALAAALTEMVAEHQGDF